MKITTITPKIALNKAFLKERVNRTDIETFKTHFIQLFDRLKASEKESEEFYKNIVSDFLKNTFYTPQYEINTKGREELVIHTGKTTKDSVGVIFETKRPNSSEMITDAKPNVKALHQLIFYYLQERIEHKNIAVKHLIATDISNWYVFDENLFDRHIYQNKAFVKGYETFKQSGKNTEFFYKEVAKPILDGLDIDLECTHFSLNDFEKTVRNTDATDDKKLIALYKILSPVHLLKLLFANDSNQLDKSFYAELLHIIGLEEVKDGSKKLIQRKAKPDEFSLIENALTKIENKGFSDVPELAKLGNNKTEQAFNIALELCITWVNRILFLKLLEAQLITYHKGNKAYRFLNPSVIYDFDRLNKLFFEVLAEKTENRRGKVKAEFEKIPYLNSSLFERTDLERKTIEINYLDDREQIPILSNTVLKDDKGKKQTGSLPTLEYFLTFLESYDFTSEGTEDIQDDKRTLINASVLGLIFEKINGYKDGSFFTPSFITMYMCRETIRRAVLQKFKETNLPNFENLVNFDDLKDAISDRKQANDIINSLKICDPAVGSGHFLVSALNEIIAIKSDLDVLIHRDGKRVRNFKVEIQNDELIVTDESEGDIFQYFVNDKGVAPKEVQQLQETLFHEKQTIIENCLFGVDINPNSVKICRLRLWIELLKNAYYVTPSVLETLPNIDINIKQGNSLISRFKLNDDLSEVFKKQKFSYKAYRKAVEDYKNAPSKEAKHGLENFIREIKEQFQTNFHSRLKENKELAKFRGQLYNTQNQGDLFGGKVDKIEVDRLGKLVTQFEQKVKDIKDNAIFRDAFEWRFEFPEILNTDGVFVGFDVIIGNPPYGVIFSDEQKILLNQTYSGIQQRMFDSFLFFMSLSEKILVENGLNSFIVPNNLIYQMTFEAARKFLISNFVLSKVVNLGDKIFDDAEVPTCIYIASKQIEEDYTFDYADIRDFSDKKELLSNIAYEPIKKESVLNTFSLVFGVKEEDFDLINKINKQGIKFSELLENASYGIGSGGDKIFRLNSLDCTEKQLENDILHNVFSGGNISKYCINWGNEKIIYTTKDLIIDNYPNILKHLIPHIEKLSQKRETKNGTLPWWCLHWARNKKLYQGNKIVLRQTGDSIIAALDLDDFFVMDSVMVIKLQTETDLNLKYILALLNSRLMGFMYENIAKEKGRTFAQVKPQNIKQLPIKVISESEQKPIVTLVEKVLAAKQATPSVSTVDSEKEIDMLVYGLYGLTGEEIEIIENSIK